MPTGDIGFDYIRRTGAFALPLTLSSGAGFRTLVVVNKSWIIVGTLALGATLPVLAQSGDTTTSEDRGHAVVSEARPVGEYAGVTPGQSESPPAESRVRRQQRAREKAASSRRRRPPPATLLTWPGFQMREDGSSRFFLQTSGRVEVASSGSEGRFEVLLRNTRVHLRNNARPLETRFFNTPVVRARTERRGSDLAIVFELRSGSTARPRVQSVPSDSGYYYVYIDFASGDFVAPSSPPSSALTAESPPPAPADVEEPTVDPADDMQPGRVRVVQDEETPPGR